MCLLISFFFYFLFYSFLCYLFIFYFDFIFFFTFYFRVTSSYLYVFIEFLQSSISRHLFPLQFSFISLFTRLLMAHSVFHLPSFISLAVYLYLPFISLCLLISHSIFHSLVALMYRWLGDWSCLLISYSVCHSLIIFFHLFFFVSFY